MSKSYRYHNIIGLCGGHHTSEKYDKRLTNKGIRHKSKIIINNHPDYDDLSHNDLPTKDDIRDHYNFAKDGIILIDSKDRDLWDHMYFTKDGKLKK